MAQIDGAFEAILKDEIGETEFMKVTVEAKNWSNLIYSTELLKILIKSASHDAKLALVFCTAFARSKLYKYCLDNAINVYRLQKIGETVQLLSFFADFKMFPMPRKVCIVLESYRINELTRN
jgi:hypothetical protein